MIHYFLAFMFIWRLTALQCSVGFCHTTVGIKDKNKCPLLLEPPSHPSPIHKPLLTWLILLISILLFSCAMLCLVAQLCLTLNPMDCSPPGSCVRGDSPGKNTGVGCHGLLQGIFPTQGSTPGVQHCRRIPPRKPENTGVSILSLLQGILETRNRSRLSWITVRFFTSWATREAPLFLLYRFVS